MVSSAHANKATTAPTTTPATNVDKHPLYYQPHMIPLAVDQNGNVLAPTSPPYPPYMGNYMDASCSVGDSTEPQHYVSPTLSPHQQPPQAPPQPQHYAYVYPISPPFSVQYYTDYAHAGYQSYPGSPVLHPHQSPPMNPTSPPFSPTYHYPGTNITLSPPTHATYVIPPPGHQQRFPPLHISSPVLTGQQHHHSISPGSPPQHYLPGPYDPRGNHPPHTASHSQQQQHSHHHHQTKRPHHHRPRPHDAKEQHSDSQRQQEEEEDMELQEEYQRQLQQQQQDHPQYHSHNMYVRGLAASMTDETFLGLCGTFGSIISSKAILDQKSGDCKGYGFAMYEKEEDCLKAIDHLSSNGLQASLARVGQVSKLGNRC